ncbi:MAG TPA: bifunctional diguanylate cyclase/phosphodiesterase [Actinomycetes bacterium]|nr:bifunctional diguanylate cyclase/phosphodiesterase [Actinomycetes bacterium]
MPSSPPEVVVIADLLGRLRFVSPALREVFGYDPASFDGQALLAAVHPADLDDLRRALRRLLAERPTGPIRCRVRHADGVWRATEVSASTWRDTGAGPVVVLAARDVTDQLMLERVLAHRARHDALTELPNRRQVSEHLQSRLADPAEGDRLAVLVLGLDGFATVNDTAGHLVGDALLVALARRLSSVVRAGELLARVDGDEFAVVLEDVHAEAAVLVATRLRAAVSRPVRLGERELSVRASVGVAFARPGTTPESLLRDADLALHRAKATGRDRVQVASPELHAELAGRVELESRLRAALARREFELHYQPIVDLLDGAMVGAEALLRWWRDPATLVPPDQFLHVAEASGLVAPLGWWAFDAAIAQLAAWRAEGLDVGMSVNLSAAQLGEPALAHTVLARLERAGVDPSALTLEVTESVLVEQLTAANRGLAALRAHGVTVALDDFGTGYCGLGYLRELSVDVLKLDRSFVAGLGTDREHTVLVRAIVGLANDLGLLTVAEGVETVAQLRMLQELGAQLAQGFLFEAPQMPAHAAAHARVGFGAAVLSAAG